MKATINCLPEYNNESFEIVEVKDHSIILDVNGQNLEFKHSEVQILNFDSELEKVWNEAKTIDVNVDKIHLLHRLRDYKEYHTQK